MRVTLRARLALWAALATALAVVVVAGGLYYAVNGLLERSQFDRTLSAASAAQQRVESVLGTRGDDLFGLPRLGDLRGAPDHPLPSQADLERIADADGQRAGVELRVIGVVDGGLKDVSTPRFPQQGVPLNLRPGQYRLAEQMIVVRSLRGSQALLMVASDARALGAARQAFTQVLVWLLPMTLLLTLAIGWIVAGRLLRPVRDLEHAARQIGSGGDLRRALPGAGDRDEFARLAGTLQTSFHSLADARDREQAFLRAAAHDLRSPLAALTARVDGALARDRDAQRYRSDLREIGTDITRLSQLANHLLLLAREPGAMGRAPVPLRDLAADAVDRARELAPEADVDLDAPQAVTVPGDRVLLGQAIWNLTMNAVRHAPGATVTVTVDGLEDRARITVHDDGPGVNAGILIRLGEAFYRPDASRSGDGHGLGLALARRAAELHGGTLTLHSAEGQGFTATLEVPA